MSERESGLLNEREASRFLAVKPTTLQQWRHRAKGPAYVKLEGSIRYKMEDLLRYLDQQLIEHGRFIDGKAVAREAGDVKVLCPIPVR